MTSWAQLSDDLDTIAISSACQPNKVIAKHLVTPIVTSAIYATDNRCEKEENGSIQNGKEHSSYRHSRKGNPTRDAVENQLAQLENAKFALTYSSGTAAINNILQTFLKQGDHVVSIKTIYGGTYHLLNDFARFGVTVDYEPSFDTQRIISHIKPNTTMLWLESPVNPTLALVDIESVAKSAKEIQKNIIIVVDNTFLTPVFQRPLELGADISCYSCSKYLGGHSDLVMGSVALNSKDLYKKLHQSQEDFGAVPSTFDCYLLIRSLKTLPIRMKQHYESAKVVGQFLEKHPKVLRVIHPGFPSHPQRLLAMTQQFGHSGAIGLYLKGGYRESCDFLAALKLIQRAPGLGYDMSVANIPSRNSHANVPEEDRKSLGITDNYIRLSVGLESAASLIADLSQALDSM